MAVFTESMINERVQTFWAALQRGEFITDAAAEAGTYRKKGARWMAAAGGVRHRRGRDLQGRYLSFAEREEIALSSARGESMRCIARRLGRSPATISRELRRNADRHGGYRATTAPANSGLASLVPPKMYQPGLETPGFRSQRTTCTPRRRRSRRRSC
jgi:transposase, IS30 family